MMRKEEVIVGGAEQGGGWSALPGELLTLIDQRLIKLKHAIRFRAVCKPWRKMLAESHPIMFRQSPLSPMLMLPYCNDSSACGSKGGGGEEEGWRCRLFWDLAHNQYHHIDFVQGFEKTGCRGSALGWLFMLQLPIPVLLNPLTGKQIPLPPITSFPDVLQYNPERVGGEYVLLHPDGDKVRVGNRRLGNFFMRGLAMSADPSTSEEDCIIMAIRTNEHDRLAFCKPGWDKWTLIPHPDGIRIAFENVVFWRNQFYAIDTHGNVLRCDLDNLAAPTLSYLVSGVRIDPRILYLVVGPDDELNMVAKGSGFGDKDENAVAGGYGLHGHHHEDFGDHAHHEVAYHNDDVGDHDLHEDFGDHAHHEVAYHNEGVGDHDLHEDFGDGALHEVAYHNDDVDNHDDDDGDHEDEPDRDDQDSVMNFTDGDLDDEVELQNYWSNEFRVYRLNGNTNQWDRVGSIGDFALFLGTNTPICLSTKDYPRLKANCIYFSDDGFDKQVQGRLGGHDMGIWHISDDTFESLCCGSWYKPSLIWPPPVWILP